MKPRNSLPVIFFVLILVIVFSSCSKKDEVRSYKEKIVKKDIPQGFHGKNTMESTVKKTDIKWETPEDWKLAENASKLRIATYSFKSGDKEALCTMIPLSGDGGGIFANVQMWLSTLKKEEAKEAEIKEFISKQKKFKTSDSHEGIFLDFTEITGKESGNSIIVSIITLHNKTLFIKFSGDTSLVIQNREKLMALSKSINIGH
ncbi:MAG: hypothetical protein ABFR75_05015 [Acidobacteriota bacterium]